MRHFESFSNIRREADVPKPSRRDTIENALLTLFSDMKVDPDFDTKRKGSVLATVFLFNKATIELTNTELIVTTPTTISSYKLKDIEALDAVIPRKALMIYLKGDSYDSFNLEDSVTSFRRG